LPWKHNNALNLYCFWPPCDLRQLKTFDYSHRSATMGFLCSIEELQNLSYRC